MLPRSYWEGAPRPSCAVSFSSFGVTREPFSWVRRSQSGGRSTVRRTPPVRSTGGREVLAERSEGPGAGRGPSCQCSGRNGSRRRGARRRPDPHATLVLILDAMTGSSAVVQNGRLDILAANRLGYARYSEIFAAPPANHARFVFLDPRAHDFYPDWQRAANDTAAILRAEAGGDPYDRALCNLVGELSTRSEDFRVRWAEHNVHQHRTGVKQFRHPVVGLLELSFEAMELTADSGLSPMAYSAEPASPSQESLELLASWAATVEREQDENGSVDAAFSLLDRPET
nr:hypothetical protein [Nocardiopsis ansamitocini]